MQMMVQTGPIATFYPIGWSDFGTQKLVDINTLTQCVKEIAMDLGKAQFEVLPLIFCLLLKNNSNSIRYPINTKFDKKDFIWNNSVEI